MKPELVLVAHRTRDTKGLKVITDIASAVAGHIGTVRTSFVDVLGPNPRELLANSGRPAVMASAGSSDRRAQRESAVAAGLLGDLVGEVNPGFVATGSPTVADVVARLKRAGRRVFIASHLLAPGYFHTRLGDCGAHAVTGPLGAHSEVVELLARRFGEAAAVGGTSLQAVGRSRRRRRAPDPLAVIGW